MAVGMVATFGALASVATVASADPAPPEPPPLVDDPSDLPELQDHLDEAVAEEAGLLIAWRQATERRIELDGQVVEMTAALARTVAALRDAEATRDQAYADVVSANLRLDHVNGRLLAAQERLRQEAVAAYTGGASDDDMSVAVLGADDVNELGSGLVYAEAVVEHQHDLVTEVEALRAAVDELAEATEAARRRAEARRDDVAARRSDLEDARRDLLEVQAAARAEEARQADLLRQVQLRRADYEARIAAIERENARIAALLREYQAALERQEAAEAAARELAEAEAARHDAPLTWPLPDATVSSGYGYRIHPIYNIPRLHTGLDMGGASGEPIVAAADGVVVLAGVNGGYGNCVVVYHGDGMSTLYGHQSRVGVDVGDRVEREQVVGFVGSTGVSTGPHLHFEVRMNGTPVDPMPFFEEREETEEEEDAEEAEEAEEP